MRLHSSIISVVFPLLASCTFVGKDDWSALDKDGDGHMSSEYAEGDDCDDEDPDVHPGSSESCNGKDDDCDGSTDEEAINAHPWYTDLDGDGYGDPSMSTSACEGPTGTVGDNTDCDDNDASEYPGATWFEDEDGDGYGAGAEMEQCEKPEGWVADSSDCDDSDPSSYPEAPELCDGLDNDCDGTEDESVDYVDWYEDFDGDGYGNAEVTTSDCAEPKGYVDNAGDCNDSDGQIHPDVEEACDGVDNDCDELIDFDDPGMTGDSTWYRDADEDGFGDSSLSTEACEQPTGYVRDFTDCDDGRAGSNPEADEYCNGEDDDCDGGTDEDDAVDAVTWWPDIDTDGFGASTGSETTCVGPSGYVEDNTDCDDAMATTNPVASEYCDGHDDDCDGLVDESDAIDARVWYADTDGDGYGNAMSELIACALPAEASADDTDCDDTTASVSPAADEVCDIARTDEDCDELINSDDPGATGLLTWYADADGDGYGNEMLAIASCDAHDGYVLNPDDCDDREVNVNPSASEFCNRLDDDCDGTTDESDAVDVSFWYPDLDGDGYGRSSVEYISCSAPSDYTDNDEDCDDDNPGINPGEEETCSDGIDVDCDGALDCDDGDCMWLAECAVSPSSTTMLSVGYIVFGGAIAHGTGSGHDVAMAGDMDGDGDDEGLLSAPSASDNYYTSFGGVLTNFGDPDSSGSTISGYAGSGFGDSVESAGDINLDGYADIMVGTQSGESGGSAYLFVGPGLSGSASSALASFTAESSFDGVGNSLAHLGDTNSDGYPDLLIGAEYNDCSGDGSGVAYLIHGPVTEDMALSDVSTRIEGSSAGTHLSIAVAGPGDLDGDGINDVVLAEDWAIYIFYGPLSGTFRSSSADLVIFVDNWDIALAAAGDTNDDGLMDLLIGSSRDDIGADEAGAAFVFNGPVTGTTLSDASVTLIGDSENTCAGDDVSTAGDVNGDGVTDILIGGSQSCGGYYSGPGAAWLVLGPISGTTGLASADWRLNGWNTGDLAGWSVAGGGDIDADGLDDLLVGAPGYNGGEGMGYAVRAATLGY